MFFPPPQRQVQLTKIDPTVGIRIAQTICVSLIIGALLFMGVTLIVSGQQRNPMISYMAAAFAGMNTILRFIVPGIVVRSQLQKLTSGTPEDLPARLFPIFQTRMIVGMAILDGAVFFNLVGYLVERQIWSLAIAGGLISLMAMMFPTLHQFENWVEDVKRDLASQF